MSKKPQAPVKRLASIHERAPRPALLPSRARDGAVPARARSAPTAAASGAAQAKPGPWARAPRPDLLPGGMAPIRARAGRLPPAGSPAVPGRDRGETAQPKALVATAASYLWSAAQAHPYIAGATALLGLWWLGSWWWGSTIIKAPKSGQYTLRDLKREHMWRLYINPKDFEKAERAATEHKDAVITDPGDYYGYYDENDRVKPKPKQTDWFKKSMQAALGLELNFGNDNGRLGTRVDQAEYVKLHDLVTSKFDEGEKGGTNTSMRARSGHETMTAFPIDDWGGKSKDIADDLASETVGGRSVCIRWKESLGNPWGNKSYLTFFDPSDSMIRVCYGQSEGGTFTQKIFDRYYSEVGAAKNDDARLLAIVRAIRAIHVVHPFRDANGRLHVQLLLNKFLLEQGFSIAVLDPRYGLGAFGGVFSASQLVELVKAGMHRFKSYCKAKSM